MRMKFHFNIGLRCNVVLSSAKHKINTEKNINCNILKFIKNGKYNVLFLIFSELKINFIILLFIYYKIIRGFSVLAICINLRTTTAMSLM